MKKDNVLYKTPSAVVLGVEEDYPQFGDLKKIFVVDQQAFLYVRKMKTTSFNEHHHAYVLEASTEYRAVPVEDLYSPFPLHVRILYIDGSPTKVVVPKFHIVETLQI